MKADVTVLMYHAIADENGACPGADAHYCVSRHRFASNLQQVAAAGMRCASVVELLARPQGLGDAVALTFDDGHASNLSASELIVQSSGSADFFVNPSTVGTQNYLGWAELRRMAEWGMSIQSHGFHHRYFDEMPVTEIRNELRDSKRSIEDHVGRAVTVFAPPGGRVSPDLADIAEECGYQAICSSRVGLWVSTGEPWDIPRFAILQTTSERQFDRWIRQDRVEILSRRARYLLLRGAKQLLGNQGYERLRQSLLRNPA